METAAAATTSSVLELTVNLFFDKGYSVISCK